MTTRIEGINDNLSPQQLNRKLIRIYGYDLFDFTYSLAIVLSKKPPPRLWNIWLIRKFKIEDIEILKKELNRLKRIRNQLIKDLKKHLIKMHRINNPLLPKEYIPEARNIESTIDEIRNEDIIRIYKINETIGIEINNIKTILNIFKRTKGPPASVKNILGSLWSLVMRDETRIHIDIIADLMGWFYLRLQPTNYADELGASPSLEEILRFMGRFGSMVEQDKSEIFYYNLKLERNINKIYPFQIIFDENGPRFLPRDIDENQVSRAKIIFADGTEF